MGGCCGSKLDGSSQHQSGDSRWASPRKNGPRPSLADLKRLNQPGVEELGGERIAFGADASKNPDLRSGASCLEIMEKNTVLVAVRVRPLNQKERTAKSAECLSHDGATNITLQRGGAEKDCRFSFDCIMRQGVSQRDIFDRTARPLLHKVLEGYNGCLFAYGQTGSGKTFTMQGEGSGENQGVIPLLCKELFSVIEERSMTKTICVQCSILEIYNEKLNDLLVDKGEDLQIRDDTGVGGRGIYVEGASELSAQSSEDVLAMINKGNARRAVGKTNMNEHSSRSHSVLTMQISCRDAGDAAGVTQTVSKLHLIDLAGSERQKATGASGQQLKEGAQINLSLSALGNVINALTDGKKDGSKGRHIPYRDSKLTRLLQDSLGGNSYTVMICNISPAVINAEETLSSLRFAERAKKIENKATVNQDPKNAKIAQLMAENKLLRTKVDRLEAHIARLEEHY